jgi:hypothetical protein
VTVKAINGASRKDLLRLSDTALDRVPISSEQELKLILRTLA